jgi:hypothetical protein
VPMPDQESPGFSGHGEDVNRFEPEGLGGYFDVERTPLPKATFQPNTATMQLGKALGQSESQPSPLVMPRCRAIHLLELVKDTFLVYFGNADTGVRDAEANNLTRCRSPHRYQTTFRGELDRVGQQVVQDLLDLASIGRQSDSIV